MAVSVGCRPSLEPIEPSDLGRVTVGEVATWVEETHPRMRMRYDVEWTAREAGSRVDGRGAVRIAPPDSMRLDLQGPLGFHAKAVVFGREILCASPKRNFQELALAVPLLWAAAGMAVPPRAGEQLAGRDDAIMVSWRYVAGPDTLLYIRERGDSARFVGELRHRGRVIGRATTVFDPAAGHVQASRIVLPHGGFRIDFEVRDAVADDEFPPEAWACNN